MTIKILRNLKVTRTVINYLIVNCAYLAVSKSEHEKVCILFRFILFIHSKCVCGIGYLDELGDGTSCKDLDECLHGQVCPEMSQCLNQPGGYTCECQTGYNLTTGADGNEENGH